MHNSRFKQGSKVDYERPTRQGCGDNKVAATLAGGAAQLAVALRGDSRDWLRLALEDAKRDPLGVALDAAALWEVLRERAVKHLDREQAGRD